MPAVGTDGVDGAVVAFDLADGCEVVHVPDLDNARTAGAELHGSARNEGQGAHPVLVCRGDLLGKERAVRVGSGDPVPGTLESPGGRGAGSIAGPRSQALQGLEMGPSAPFPGSNLRPRTTEEAPHDLRRVGGKGGNWSDGAESRSFLRGPA